MEAIALNNNDITILDDLKRSIIDFVSNTRNINLLKSFAGLINNSNRSLVDDLKSESVRTGKKISELVSPSGDEWFDDEENLRSLECGIQAADRGELVEVDIQTLLKELSDGI